MAEPDEEREKAIEALYALPLDEFTSARDELARRLRGEGDRSGAAEVKGLRKPSVAAWALNRVRRSEAADVDRLIEAGARLRDAQERLLAGGGREALQQAGTEERALVGQLAASAERELAASGRPVNAATQEKLRATLHAAAADAEAREALAAGRLVRDHEASGLGPLGGQAGPVAPPQAPPAKRAAARTRRIERLEERLERARATARELEEEAAQAARRAQTAEREAARAAKELDRTRRAATQGRERAEAHAAKAAALERELGELRG